MEITQCSSSFTWCTPYYLISPFFLSFLFFQAKAQLPLSHYLLHEPSTCGPKPLFPSCHLVALSPSTRFAHTTQRRHHQSCVVITFLSPRYAHVTVATSLHRMHKPLAHQIYAQLHLFTFLIQLRIGQSIIYIFLVLLIG